MRRLFVDCLIVLALLGVPAYLALSYTGPYRWLADVQIAHTDGYSPRYTWIFVQVAWLLVCFVTLAIIGHVMGKPHPELAMLARLKNGGLKRIGVALGIVAPLALMGLAVRSYAMAERYRDPVVVPLGTLAETGKCPSPYIELTDATPWPEHALTLEPGRDAAVEVSRMYIPLMAQGAQRGPVSAFLEMPSRLGLVEFRGKSTFRAIVADYRLPEPVKAGFERDGLAPASSYIILRDGTTSDVFREEAVGHLALAGVIVAVGVGGFVYTLIRRRKQPQATSVGQPEGPDRCL